MSYILGTAGPQEMFVRGEGCWLIDRGGRRYLDARSGIGNMILGYGRRDIAEAMYRQALELPFVCTLRYERPAPITVDYAKALIAAAPEGLTRVRFTHTGSSATEAALLMARRYHKNQGHSARAHVVGLVGGYHGSTLMTMAAGGERMLHEAFAPMPDGFHHVAPPPRSTDDKVAASSAENLFAKIQELGPDHVSAVILEPIAGLSGTPLPRAYLQQVREFCAKHEILLIFDEVFSGLGRMGPLFAAEISGVCPDILCLSKTLAAGYAPLGAVLATDRVYDAFDQLGRHFAHGSSTDAHPVSCAAAFATLRAVTAEGALERGNRMGARLAERLAAELKGSPLVSGVRANGSYVAIDTDTSRDFMTMMNIKRHLQAECERRGVLIDYTPYIVLIVPPYVLPDPDADRLIETISSVVRHFKEEDVDPSRLRPPSASGRR